MPNNPTVIEKVRKALGRTEPLREAPTPPVLEEPITRLVHSDIGLPELFAKRAAENKMLVDVLYVEELVPRMIEFLNERGCKRLGLPVSKLLTNLEVAKGLQSAGFDVKTWDQISLDESYDLDAGVTDVWAAVAETGSLVVRASVEHGRALSLVPAVHVAVVEPRNYVPDLVDLMEKLNKDGIGSGVSLITGPSKTSDIEMNLVTGVHGPTVVKVFVLQ